MIDIVTLLASLAKSLNEGRSPTVAMQEGDWLKIFYGPRRADWVRIQRVSGGLVAIEAPPRLAHHFGDVSVDQTTGILRGHVLDVVGHKFPAPVQPVMPPIEAPAPSEPVQGAADPASQGTGKPTDPLDGMTPAEMMDFALANDISVPAHMRKPREVAAFIRSKLPS